MPRILVLIAITLSALLFSGPLWAQTEGSAMAPAAFDVPGLLCLQRSWRGGSVPRRALKRCLRRAAAPVFVVPFEAPAQPRSADVDFATRLLSLDMYVILDRSGSMASEIATVKNNLATVVNNLACPPAGAGDPATCIPDLWAGAGAVGYKGGGLQAFQNWVDLQPNPSFTAVPTTEPGGCCEEPLTFSVYATITGSGGASFGMSGVPPRSTCAGSPAALAGYATFGYPCFREGSLPVVLLVTDEPPISTGNTWKNPPWSMTVRPAMLARNAKLVGILGSLPTGNTQLDLRTMAFDTGAVDAANGYAPLVFDGADANAAEAIQQGIQTLAAGLPLGLRAVVEDDPGDAVDAPAAFVERMETLQLGTERCASALSEEDSDGDTFPDTYVDVQAGTPVCWRVVPKMNTTVAATAEWQSFHATIRIVADGVTELGTRDAYFLVPPDPSTAAIRTSGLDPRRR
jgi:hypothetical protein